MNNIALDIMMGLLCCICALTIIGLMAIPMVLSTWSAMRAGHAIEIEY